MFEESTATTDAKVDDIDNTPASADDEGDKTQPNDEIWNALRNLSSRPIAGVSDVVPNSQVPPVSDVKQEPTPPPSTEWDQLRKRVQLKPHDADAWLELIDLAEDSNDLQKLQEAYDSLLEVYPNTVRAISCIFLDRV